MYVTVTYDRSNLTLPHYASCMYVFLIVHYHAGGTTGADSWQTSAVLYGEWPKHGCSCGIHTILRCGEGLPTPGIDLEHRVRLCWMEVLLFPTRWG